MMTEKRLVVSPWRLLLETESCTDECLRCGMPLSLTPSPPPLAGGAKQGGEDSGIVQSA